MHRDSRVSIYSNHLNTGLVWYSNSKVVSPVVKWSGIQMMIGKPDWKYPVYGLQCPEFEWSCDLTIWLPDAYTVQYSDESCIMVFNNQMVTVYFCSPFRGIVFHDFLEVGAGLELDFVRDLTRNVKVENAIQIEARAAFPIWKNPSSWG